MRVCVFCGSSDGKAAAFSDAARELAEVLVGSGVELVYGGASVGMMGVLADTALAAGGRVHGVIPQQLVDHEIAHPDLTELHVVSDMHERKARMADLSDAFIALPGGIGTLEELFEIWTWGKLGLHVKPVGLLDVDGYFGPLTEFLDRMVDNGFLDRPDREMLAVDSDPRTLLARFAAYVPPTELWSRRRQSQPDKDLR